MSSFFFFFFCLNPVKLWQFHEVNGHYSRATTSQVALLKSRLQTEGLCHQFISMACGVADFTHFSRAMTPPQFESV